MADDIGYEDVRSEPSLHEMTAQLVAGVDSDGVAVVPPREIYGPSTRDGSVGAFRREAVTSCMPVITTDHAFIHEGIAYTLSGFMDVANNQTGAVKLVTAATGYVHFKPTAIAATTALKVSLLEGAAFTGGSAATPRNRNRTLATPDASTVTCTTLANATVTGGFSIGDLLVPGGGGNNQRVGGGAESAEEHVLKPSTTYVLTFANTSGNASVVGYDIFWYEENGA